VDRLFHVHNNVIVIVYVWELAIEI